MSKYTEEPVFFANIYEPVNFGNVCMCTCVKHWYLRQGEDVSSCVAQK